MADARRRRKRPVEEPAKPPGVTQDRIDQVLSSLHVRKEANTWELASLLSTHHVVITPLLQYMLAMQLLAESPSGKETGAISVWRLTFSGAKEAVYAFHRVRASRPRTVFADGINPWTGVKMRNSVKKAQ